MLRSVKTTHATVFLAPNHHIQHFGIDIPRRWNKFVYVPPIHANIMNGIFSRIFGYICHWCFQKRNKFSLIHLAGTKGKLFMLRLTCAANMSLNFNIVRRINKNHIGFNIFKQTLICFLLPCIHTNNFMLSQQPDIAVLTDYFIFRHIRNGIKFFIRFFIRSVFRQKNIYLLEIKPGNIQIQFVFKI